MQKTDCDLWPMFATVITPRLNHDDDPVMWRIAIESILSSTDTAARNYSGKDCIIAEIGCCSHWIRPHRKSRVGTAWPYGYGNVGNGFAYASLPEYDWSVKWVHDADAQKWELVTGQPTRRPLTHRITLPARTSFHPQATVHTIWTPGSPSDPKHKLTVVYGFEKAEDSWSEFTAWDQKHN